MRIDGQLGPHNARSRHWEVDCRAENDCRTGTGSFSSTDRSFCLVTILLDFWEMEDGPYGSDHFRIIMEYINRIPVE